MLPTSQTKSLLINLLLAASANQHGLRDVLTGCAHALEPTLEGDGGVSPVEFNIGAMILRAVENEEEEAVLLVFSYLDHETYVLLARDRDTGGQGEFYRWYHTINGRTGWQQEQCQREQERHLQE